MSNKARRVGGAVVAICAVAAAGIVRGTPTVGQIFSVLSNGVSKEEIAQHVKVPLPANTAGSEDDDVWTAKLLTSGPANFQVVDVTLLPQGRTGWHSHPGILLISLVSGSLEWYDSQCIKHVYNAGDSWTENTEIHDVRNIGAANAHFTVTYVIANGQPRRIDQPQPACGAGLGLE